MCGIAGIFNLSGDAKRPITDHILQLACEEVLELDIDKLPTGCHPVWEPTYKFNCFRGYVHSISRAFCRFTTSLSVG